MNDSASSATPSPPSASTPTPAAMSSAPIPAPVQNPASASPVFAWVSPTALALAIVALLALAAVFWHLQGRMLDQEMQLARRLGEFDTSSKEARSAAKDVRVTVEGLVGRVAALESRAQESQSQQLALSAMYQELARGQDERVVADIEQTLLLAQQQLHLAGNVRAAVLGLEAAEMRLTKLEKPQFARLRDAISRDLARIKLLPAADIVGLNARLDALVQNADALKFESDTEPVDRETAAAAPLTATSRVGQVAEQLWSELRQLIRIRRVDHPDLPLLTPNQAYFLRQNLKLRLLSARLAVLQRDEATFRNDVLAAREWIEQYFNLREATTQSMLESLVALEKAPVSLKDADISESLKAMRAWRGGQE